MQLDAAIPTRRFGRALRAARRANRLGRRVAAARLGITPRLLAAWERGTLRVDEEHHAALVDLYGEQLTCRVPARRPVRVEPHRVVVGSRVRILADRARDDVLPAYAELLAAVRGTKPGAKPPLRASDLQVLADELGHDVWDIEARIVALLGCTVAEASTVHAELRRRALVPAVGLAVAVTAWAGALAATQSGVEGTASADTRPITNTQAAPTTTAEPTPSTTIAPAAAPTSTTAPAPAPEATPATTPAATTPAATSAPTLPPGNEGAGYESSATSAPDVDDPPVSILPGETPTIVQP